MERFKVCEKETKTKAFSKEGLGQQPKTVSVYSILLSIMDANPQNVIRRLQIADN